MKLVALLFLDEHSQLINLLQPCRLRTKLGSCFYLTSGLISYFAISRSWLQHVRKPTEGWGFQFAYKVRKFAVILRTSGRIKSGSFTCCVLFNYLNECFILLHYTCRRWETSQKLERWRLKLRWWHRVAEHRRRRRSPGGDSVGSGRGL